MDKGDPDESLANDPLGLKQLGKAFGSAFGRKQEADDTQQGGGKKKGRK